MSDDRDHRNAVTYWLTVKAALDDLRHYMQLADDTREAMDDLLDDLRLLMQHYLNQDYRFNGAWAADQLRPLVEGYSKRVRRE